ncbi:hypothetical protein EYF80_003705 [Liparis tanakae]|uniref:Uncharacterized protein n=1 Tax=Liparis tanakae TaxID=230148 RepID=A0A4Z2J7D4_9TELE|nr:hypothetical protein EYF80_003705 [Liparis tanakae]
MAPSVDLLVPYVSWWESGHQRAIGPTGGESFSLVSQPARKARHQYLIRVQGGPAATQLHQLVGASVEWDGKDRKQAPAGSLCPESQRQALGGARSASGGTRSA